MEKKAMLKPNSHKCLRRDEFNYWSALPLDLLIDVFKRLRFVDFQRAKSVCSSWHLASKQSLPNNQIQIPWLILFPDKYNNNNSCTLFNPEEESKLYKTQDLGVEFTKSVCLATCGCWLFMQDTRYNLFILNLLTNERINLPPLKSTKNVFYIQSPVLWIDENTKEYIVLWTFLTKYVVYSRKGDQFWSRIRGIAFCNHIVYKDHKLYISSSTNSLRILDFSREVPRDIHESSMMIVFKDRHEIIETRLVITLRGDVLRVNRVLNHPKTWSFNVYKIYSRGVLMEEAEQVVSLGDEAIVLDLGITVFANDLGGFRRNSIYFVPEFVVDKKLFRANMYDAFLFNIQTEKMEKLEKFDCSRARLSKARWFLPSLK